VNATPGSPNRSASRDARLPTYSVVSPVKDEAEHLARTASSLIKQTHRPTQWVIVDDGSVDDTRRIAEAYATDHEWITVIASGRTGRRARGAPIVEAFDRGLEALHQRPDIVVKLDGDLFLPAHYFEWVAAVFARDPRAGVVGGVVWIYEEGTWRLDYGRSFTNVNGVAKAYRLACLDDIGGLRHTMGWDGIDEYGAHARGWHVHVLSELNILHYKRRGSKQPWYRARWEEGLGNHYMGYRWQFLLLRVSYRALVERPRVLGGLVLGAGFLYAALRSLPQVDDPAAKEELRRQQRARMRALVPGQGTEEPAGRLPDGGPAFWF
jgi:biofilm PGA synthesis N-glycosyltransferase PgaC